MKKIFKTYEKTNVSYFIGLFVFVAAAFFRFYDRKLWKHQATFDFMKNEQFALVAIGVYFAVCMLFLGVCIRKTAEDEKKMMRYLAAFMSVFAFPIFLPKYYFGSLDMYAWMLVIMCCTFLVLGRRILSLITAGLCDLMVIFSIYQNGWNPDVREVMSLQQFLAAIVLLSPYLFIAWDFFRGVQRKQEQKSRIILWILFLLGIPNAVMQTVMGDYARAIVYTFMYYILIVMTMMALQHQPVVAQMRETKDKLKQMVPIPSVVIAYPLLIMTFWIAGPITLFTEVFTGK